VTASYDAVVIGAGANGLVAATTLARAGKRVVVLEQGDRVGGQARTIEFAAGFHAPPLGLDAGWLPPQVARDIGIVRPPMTVPDAAITVASADGGFFALPRDPARATAAIRRHSPVDADRWLPFAMRILRLARFLQSLYTLPAPDIDTRSIREVLPLLGVGRKFRALGRDGMTDLLRVLPMPVHDLLDDELQWATLKAAVGAGGVRDLRQGPRSGGTSFVLLHYLVGAPPVSLRTRGYWRDGPDAFAAVVDSAARSAGVAIRCGAPVARIVVRDDAVAGIALANGDEIAARTVISTADPVRTMLGMVDPVWLDPEVMHAVRNIKLRGCTAFLQYALDRLPELPGVSEPASALAGIVSLTPTLDALERAADAAKYGTVSDQPHVEITVPSVRWPSIAPNGKHVLVARMQYAPYELRDGATWDEKRGCALADTVTAAIARVSPRFGESVLHRAVLTPRDLEDRFGLTGGAVTHGELTLDQVLFMRPIPGWGRHAMPIDGLYLGGAGAHPGPGVIGTAGWLAARRALADAGR
jgi:phytoene dehydrogenase-like protein